MDLSVIVCTHNPRMDYLERVLAALRTQTVPSDQWELLVIDNHSATALKDRIDLTWHPHAQCLREDELGLTPARLRGICESKADLIVFVDDDNVLAANYLEETLAVARQYPALGVWGGHITAEFESTPPECVRDFVKGFAVQHIEQDMWACCWPPAYQALPCGAGMTVRHAVATRYSADVRHSHLRLGLDRKGPHLTAAGDTDLAFTALKCGLGMGKFTRLRLAHLIPEHRLQPDYQERSVEGMSYSWVLLAYIHGLGLPPDTLLRRLYSVVRAMRRSGFARVAYRAEQRGTWRALRDLRRLSNEPSHPQ
jgi:glycosyltransferase involved in cell wall biosynthesis